MSISRNVIITGDCMQMKDLPDQCVHCVITSPPYFGLRSYGIEPSDFPEVTYTLFGFPIVVPAMTCELGHEKDPKEFVGHIVHIFREVKRVLRDDGTLWLNFGDSYCSSGKDRTEDQVDKHSTLQGGQKTQYQSLKQPSKLVKWLKPKDMIGIPWMVAFALRDDGWYLRMDNIWGKPNPMPESVRDRPTKAHEYFFLLAKSERYFYDAEAIKTESAENSIKRWSQDIQNQERSTRAQGKTNGNMKAVGTGAKYAWERAIDGSIDDTRKGKGEELRKKTLLENQAKLGKFRDKQRGHSRKHAGFNDRWDHMTHDEQTSMGANKRSVWMIPTQGFKEAHFATFPEDLVVDPIKAGTSKYGVCSKCGAPWYRVVDKELVPGPKAAKTFVVDGRDADADAQDQGANRQKDGHKPGWIYESSTTGWKATCQCNAEVVPAVVLDPFGGAGTLMLVARKLGRDYIAYEMKPANVKLSETRLTKELGLFK